MVVVWLLRAAWIALILPILIAYIPSPKLNAFHELLLGFAKRGKILPSSSKKFSVPQKFFCHFYILAVIWTTFLLVITWLFAYKTAPEMSVFLLLLMEAQVLRRLYESIYVFQYSPSARMHIFGYVTGLLFYTAAPLSLCCAHASVFKFLANLFAEFVVKGKNGMQVMEFDTWGHVNPFLQLRWYVWIGAAIFAWGWIHQRSCHLILGSLRKNGQKVDEYAIPHGDWFEYVSSPHYLAEIVIYGGLVIASGFDITILLLFGFVVANLAFAAAETQKWYLRKFDNYPTNRFVIIPFVY